MRSLAILRRHTARGSLLLLSLVAILAVSLVLGYNAIDMARHHRDSVENALRDYASMAGWEYSSITRDNLNSVLSSTFDEVTRDWSGRGELPPLQIVVDEMRRTARAYRCDCRDLREPIAFFRMDLQDGSIVVRPDTLQADILRSLADTLVAHRAQNSEEREGIVTLPAGTLTDSTVLVTYSTSYGRGWTPRGLYGFVSKPTAYGELFHGWYARHPLLPPAVTEEQPNDSLLHLSVRTADETVLFESPLPSSTGYAARDTMGVQYGGLIVEAAIRADVADRLVIGGLPRSRLPLIVTLLLMTLGLGIAALHQLRRERQLARLRDDFVSGVSHELRTPLAQVRMFAELLESGKLRNDEERERSLGVIDREARRLTQLVENILQFAKAGRTQVELKVERLDLSKTLDGVIEAFKPLSMAKGVTIRAEIQDGLGLRADRDALGRVLLNLLDNAVKYGPERQTITIRAARNDDTIRIVVDDQGPGIPQGERQRIWEPYTRLRRGSQNAAAGTGIGLAVVAELVALHAGRCWNEDTAEGGARFVVELPGAIEIREGDSA